MTDKTMNLRQARWFATRILEKYGKDYRNLVTDQRDECVTGCVNVVLTKDGTRRAPSATADELIKDGYTLEPGCFVGTILITAGLATAEDFVSNGVYGARVGEAVLQLEITLTPKARVWLATAQQRQDNGATWGEAFSTADRKLLDQLAVDDTL